MWTIDLLKEHLRSRGMDPDLYTVAYDPEYGLATFYLHNGVGIITGYQQYNPNQTSKKMNDPKESRYYTYLPSGVDGFFGLEAFDKNKKDIYIVEGVFKAGVLHRLGFNAIAVLTNHPKRLKPWFKILKANYNLIAIGDPDSAGQRLVNTVKQGFLSPLDLDEMEDEEILDLLKRNSAR